MASVRRQRSWSLATCALITALAAGCAATPVGSLTAPSPVIASQGVPSQAPTASTAAVATATATTRPTPTPLPTTFKRPTDMATDGACEEPHPCLGLISVGRHHSQLFTPGFGFTMPERGWQNLAMSPGNVSLRPIDAPGDEIGFFTHGKLTKTDGTLDFSVPLTVDGITGWFVSHPDLVVTEPANVTVGGLDGKRFTLTSAPSSTAHYPPDCPVLTCVNLWKAQGATWQWDWGIGSSEKQRMDVLAAKDGVVLVIVDSLDGTTYDSLIKTADKVLSTVTFDKP
ncbi:MAG: hypothetical protein ACJ779_04650 [Chloroflexota bacterium]